MRTGRPGNLLSFLAAEHENDLVSTQRSGPDLDVLTKSTASTTPPCGFSTSRGQGKGRQPLPACGGTAGHLENVLADVRATH